MRVGLEWLYEYCDAGKGARELGEDLTMTGTKLEAVHRHGVSAVEQFVAKDRFQALVERLASCSSRYLNWSSMCGANIWRSRRRSVSSTCTSWA